MEFEGIFSFLPPVSIGRGQGRERSPVRDLERVNLGLLLGGFPGARAETSSTASSIEGRSISERLRRDRRIFWEELGKEEKSKPDLMELRMSCSDWAEEKGFFPRRSSQ